MIKGLETRYRPPRLGVIGLGVMVPETPSTPAHPKEVPYFVLPRPLPGLEERPTSLRVMLPADDIDHVFPTAFVSYNTARLLTLVCDGDTCQRIPPDGPKPAPEPCQKVPGEPCPCGATAKGRLNVVLLHGQVGVYQVVIGGERRVADMLTELTMFRTLMGRLTGIDFTLRREPTPVQIRDKNGRRLSRTGYPVHLRWEGTVAQALAIGGADRPGLTAPALAEPHEEHDTEDVAGPAGLEADTRPTLFPSGVLPEAEEEWTVESCYAAAKRLDIAVPLYRTFLERTYGSADALSARALAEQRRTLRRAETDAAYAARVRSRITARANGGGGK